MARFLHKTSGDLSIPGLIGSLLGKGDFASSLTGSNSLYSGLTSEKMRDNFAN
jgi:hypothetical protein